MEPNITLRNTIRPGDLGFIVYLHGVLYSREYGFDPTFEAYVAEPLSRFVLHASPRERIWIAERETQIVGCIAIVAAAENVAQLRWFLVDPTARGHGLGTRLIREAIAFSRTSGYASIILWTVHLLEAAARVYVANGFRKTEERPGSCWGVDLVEEKYERTLDR